MTCTGQVIRVGQEIIRVAVQVFTYGDIAGGVVVAGLIRRAAAGVVSASLGRFIRVVTTRPVATGFI